MRAALSNKKIDPNLCLRANTKAHKCWRIIPSLVPGMHAQKRESHQTPMPVAHRLGSVAIASAWVIVLCARRPFKVVAHRARQQDGQDCLGTVYKGRSISEGRNG